MSTAIFKDMSTAYVPKQPIGATPAVQPEGIQFKEAIAANNVQGDVTQFSTAKAERRGPIQTLKLGIANFKKGFATLGEYTKGVYRSIIGAIVAGSVVFTAGTINNTIKTKAAQKLLEAGQELPKKIKGTVHAKALAITAAGLAVVGNMWRASLNAQDARSDIHDRYIGTNKK